MNLQNQYIQKNYFDYDASDLNLDKNNIKDKEKTSNTNIRMATMDDIIKIKELYIECKRQFDTFSYMEESEIDYDYIHNLLKESLERGVFFIYEKNNKITAGMRCIFQKEKATKHIGKDCVLIALSGHEVEAVKVVKVAIDYVKKNMPFILEMKASYRASNIKSGNFQKKLGFRDEYVGRNEIFLNGKFEDIVHTSMIM